MDHKDYLDGAFNEETGEYNAEKAQKNINRDKDKLNILLMGATGVGKSALVNAMFGDNVVESQPGEPVTQFLSKIEIESKGLILWDTKGIEAQDYANTKQQLIDDIKKVLIKLLRKITMIIDHILRGYVSKNLLLELNLEI